MAAVKDAATKVVICINISKKMEQQDGKESCVRTWTLAENFCLSAETNEDFAWNVLDQGAEVFEEAATVLEVARRGFEPRSAC